MTGTGELAEALAEAIPASEPRLIEVGVTPGMALF